ARLSSCGWGYQRVAGGAHRILLLNLLTPARSRLLLRDPPPFLAPVLEPTLEHQHRPELHEAVLASRTVTAPNVAHHGRVEQPLPPQRLLREAVVRPVPELPAEPLVDRNAES